MKEEKIICLYRDIKKEYRCTANLLEQAEESKSIIMFSNHEGRPLIKEFGFILIQPSSLVTQKLIKR